MSSLNKVMLIGRLGKDPEAQHFDSGALKVSFSLATDESYTNRDGQRVELTEWHNIVVWRKMAEIAEKYLSKGKLVYIEGKLKTRSWEDADGKKNYRTEVEASTFRMLGSKAENSGGSGSGSYQQSSSAAPANSVQEAAAKPTAKVDQVNEELDDLPF